MIELLIKLCGERGILTLDTVSRIHAFQACAFNRSATSPNFSVLTRVNYSYNLNFDEADYIIDNKMKRLREKYKVNNDNLKLVHKIVVNDQIISAIYEKKINR